MGRDGKKENYGRKKNEKQEKREGTGTEEAEEQKGEELKKEIRG